MAGIYDMYSINNTDNTNDSKNGYFVVPNRTGSSLQSKQKSGSIQDFVSFAFPRNYNIMRYLGLPKQLALQRAIDMTMQHGSESQYGRSNASVNKNNRSGFMSNGKTINYATPELNDTAIVKSYRNNPNWMRAINSPTSYGYFYNLQHPKANEHSYEGNMTGTDQYYNLIQGNKTLRKTIDAYIKAGNTKNWTMNNSRRDLDDMIVLG
jgi:hypothetical protein